MEPLFGESPDREKKLKSMDNGLRRLDWLLNQFKKKIYKNKTILDAAEEGKNIKKLRRLHLKDLKYLGNLLERSISELKKADLDEVV